jgi:hypothetical protein
MSDDDNQLPTLSRRDAILRVSAMFGGAALVGQAAMLVLPEDAEAATPNLLFNSADIAMLDEIAETILPETDTPGARAAGVGSFIARMVVDTYYDRERRIFRQGLRTINERSRAAHGGEFMALTPEQRVRLLEVLDAEQHAYMADRPADEPAHFFRMLKELTLLGYFTSEIGYTRAMRYVETPGRFDPCVPWQPGDKTWARHA